jgi:hypothetical protein
VPHERPANLPRNFSLNLFEFARTPTPTWNGDSKVLTFAALSLVASSSSGIIVRGKLAEKSATASLDRELQRDTDEPLIFVQHTSSKEIQLVAED